MARTNLPVSSLAGNGALLNDAGTSIDATNGMNIVMPNGIPAPGGADRLVLYVTNTTGSTKTVTVKAGVNPPSFLASKGDQTTGNLTATTGTAFIGPFDPARVLQANGSISVDFAASMTGKIWAILLPRSF